VAPLQGYALRVGLPMRPERGLEVRIEKDQASTDWAGRPLNAGQLVDAREDVAHLLPLYVRLRADLKTRGRTAWVEEELRALEDAGRFAGLPDDERYRTVRGWQRLGARELAVLRELAAWRERSAARANIRPNFIANDIVLTSLAARPVTSIEELKQMRGLTAGTVDRHAKGLLGAIRAGLAWPPERCPEPAERHRRKGPPPGLVVLLRAA